VQGDSQTSLGFAELRPGRSQRADTSKTEYAKCVSAQLASERADRAVELAYPNIFGVGIRARIFSNSSAVTRLMPFLRQDSSFFVPGEYRLEDSALPPDPLGSLHSRGPCAPLRSARRS
jgi:hypothetical protein